MTSLQPLAKYAHAPATDAPPELLPADPAHEWGVENAARGALGLLVAGEAPSERLFQVADYLLTFCPSGYHRGQLPDSELLNGTALALCGYVCHGAHPEAELWRLTGCARLATELHKRKAALEDQLAADCLFAVCLVADELEAPVLADIVSLRERMWGSPQDQSRVELLHVSEEEYPSHMTDPAPVDQIGAMMAARDWQWELRSGAVAGTTDLQAAEEACRDLITLRAHMLVRHQFGSEIDWHLKLFDDVESTVSLGAQPFIRHLARAWEETGDEKFAHHAARMLWSFYRMSPMPNHRQTEGPWRTLEVGNRQTNVWPIAVGLLGRTDAFDAATHSMLARSRLEHMRYLLAYCARGGNWYQVESAGMAAAALCSPELRHADAYLRVAMRRLKWINATAYTDDGFQFELSPLYHMFPTGSMFAVLEAARARGVELPDDFMQLMEKAHEMYLYAAQPNWLLPTLNDNGAQPRDPADVLREAARAFDRDDFLWGATHGEQGREPDHASHIWPDAGYHVMRDKWGEDGQYLLFDGGPYGDGHQHEDKLNFVLYSHGRLLLGDPNIYSYAPTELTRYFRSPRAHNSVLVEGKGQARRYRLDTRHDMIGRNEWVVREDFDFVSSEYIEGWATGSDGSPAEDDGVDLSLSHRRAIFYVKPGYWILCDLIRGEDEDERSLEQLFHLAPVFEPGAPMPVRAGEVAVDPSAIITREAGLSNLAILPVDREGLSATARKGETSPPRGWYGVYGEFPAWEVALDCRRTLPARMDAVLFPMPPGSEAHPTVTRLRADESVTAFRIVGEGLDDTFILCEEGVGPVRVGDIEFEGRALLVRRGTVDGNDERHMFVG